MQFDSLLDFDGNWRRSHYILMEQLINDKLKSSPLMTENKKSELGTTISFMTLKRFCEKSYDNETKKDLRFFKSIDKLCIFLGYKNFSDFSAQYSAQDVKTIPVEDDSMGNIPDDEFFTKFIEDFLAADYQCFRRPLDEIDEVLSPYLFSDGPYFTRLHEARKFVEENSYVLETEKNLSSYELITAHVLSKDANSCVCETSEYWYIAYKSLKTGKDIIYNQRNNQVYFFRNRGGVWKIWNNFNPNAGHWVEDSEKNS